MKSTPASEPSFMREELPKYTKVPQLVTLLDYVDYALEQEGEELAPGQLGFLPAQMRKRLAGCPPNTMEELVCAAQVKDAVYLLDLQAKRGDTFLVWTRRRKLTALIFE